MAQTIDVTETNGGVAKTRQVPYETPPKVYRALLTQSSTDAPTATVLENTLGGTVVWTRDNTGRYDGTLAGAFATGTTAPIELTGKWDKDGLGVVSGAKLDADTYRLDTWGFTDITSHDDGVLYNTRIEILVYP